MTQVEQHGFAREKNSAAHEQSIVVRVSDLTIGWGDVVLAQNVTFEIERGDVFAILGGSGCGKSTLLRYIIGLETPMRGQIEVQGVVSSTSDDIVQKPSFGVMFQSGALLGSLTVGENVALALEEWSDLPEEAVAAIVRAKLNLVGLRQCEDKLPAELSGGMKKRAAIARAMVLEPSLLFLDEPSAGLDPVSACELDTLIATLNRTLGITVVMVTHELESILTVGKHCIMLDREQKGIIARGDPRKLRDSSRVETGGSAREREVAARVHAFFHRTKLETP
jgi:phospholipid/cholesterol/gamma-HCH transport system ATP-binding protein